MGPSIYTGVRQRNVGPSKSSAAMVVASLLNDAGLLELVASWLKRAEVFCEPLASMTTTCNASAGTLARCNAAKTGGGSVKLCARTTGNKLISKKETAVMKRMRMGKLSLP